MDAWVETINLLAAIGWEIFNSKMLRKSIEYENKVDGSPKEVKTSKMKA